MKSQSVPKNTQQRFSRLLLLGAAIASPLAASANVLVTFQVDMSTAAFNPNTQTVVARGSFNGWNAFALTNNPAGANTNLWTGTTNIPGNGTVMQYKYSIEPGTNYEGVVEGGTHNRLITLPSANGSSITLPQVYFGDSAPSPATVTVTFEVDMAQQINTGAFIRNSSSVYARGFFNGWAQGGPMTNDPTILRTNQNGLVTSNVYVFPFDITGSPGQTTDFKYYIDTGGNWESPAANSGDPVDNNNRFFNLGAGTAQSLPVLFFNDSPYAPVATNATTFQVDMTAQVLAGNFVPASGTVEVRGNFNSWGTPQILCTNDPAAPNTNIYKTVVSLVDGVGATEFYKFWSTVTANGGWETMVDNRSLKIVAGTAQTLPVVFFSNVNPVDLLPVDTVVTFSVNMTNAVGNDSHQFDPVNDQLYVNGIPSFFTWNTSLPQLTNNPIGSLIYSIDILLPAGSSIQQTYKYGINANDDEAGSGNNHVRYVRTTGRYVMPMDKFGTQHGEPASFGQLSASTASAGRVPVTWLGLPHVHLQTSTNLTAWADRPETDGASGWTSGTLQSPSDGTGNGFISSTNYSTGSGRTFFRLVQPRN